MNIKITCQIIRHNLEGSPVKSVLMTEVTDYKYRRVSRINNGKKIIKFLSKCMDLDIDDNN